MAVEKTTYAGPTDIQPHLAGQRKEARVPEAHAVHDRPLDALEVGVVNLPEARLHTYGRGGDAVVWSLRHSLREPLVGSPF